MRTRALLFFGVMSWGVALAYQLPVTEKITEKITTKNETKAKKGEFTTHILLIVADIPSSQSNTAVLNTITGGFESRIPLLCTEAGLSDYITQKSGPPKGYRYFKIPANGKPPFFNLCMPKEYLSKKMSAKADEAMLDDAQNYAPQIVSKIEKKCGLLVEHLEEITDAFELDIEAGSPQALGDELLAILQTIFTPKSAYEQVSERPRWTIIFMGHGSPCQIYDLKDIFKLGKFIKKPGDICGMEADSFATAIVELSTKINIALIHICTCFGGGFNIAYLLADMSKGIIPPYPFIITTNTLTGDVSVSSRDKYQQYFETLRNVKIELPDEKTGLPRFLPTHYSEPKSYLTTTFRPVYDAMPQALAFMVAERLEAPGCPGMKPAATNYFVELGLAGGPLVERIDAKTVAHYMKKQTAYYIPGASHAIVYVNKVPITLKLDLMGQLLSGIPGSTFHRFTSIETFGSPTDSYQLELTFGDLMATAPYPGKLFQVLRWHSTRGDVTYEVEIMKENGSYDAIITELNDSGTAERAFFKTSHPKGNEQPMKEISTEEAAKWLRDTFEPNVFLFKVIAKYQNELRFLKDAQIETLPQDA